ncbi:MAG: hypothetical protein BGO55_08985 [Sphingobacteriales bacterium 50-39]|nr:GNAT family N-acetyltransferase [Sphingobacteriales bacterium]OJW57685.1 MAG: hypothetical protein BGO55_08985 [Sphingobacteriales bacterium 50-39]
MHSIRYLKRKEIDTLKWDRCIAQAPNGWIYARSFYLDSLGHWDALIDGDYEHIMPLPVKRKYGMPYIYIPPFTGQLGIIGQAPVTQALTNTFIRHIPRRFLLADIMLNEGDPPPSLSVAQSIQRINFTLSLKEDYTSIYSQYSRDAKKNLKKTQAQGLLPCFDIAMTTIIQLYRDAYGARNKDLSATAYDKMARLGNECIRNGSGFTMGICHPEGQLLAAAFFGMDEKRIYYILGAPSPEGRSLHAVHSLIDELIKKYAGTGITFDFEGSDIPSVAAFYRKFNPQAMPYHFIQIIRPRLLRLFFRQR